MNVSYPDLKSYKGDNINIALKLYADAKRRDSMNSSLSEINELEAEYAKINRYLHEHGINADPLKDYESILAARDKLYESHGFKDGNQFEASPGKAYTNKHYDEHNSSIKKGKGTGRPGQKDFLRPYDQADRMSRVGSGSAKRSERSRFDQRS